MDNLIYKVKVGYVDFVFEDAEEALKFAQTAWSACTDDRDVSIELEEGDDE